jgi:hypothetical protein
MRPREGLMLLEGRFFFGTEGDISWRSSSSPLLGSAVVDLLIKFLFRSFFSSSCLGPITLIFSKFPVPVLDCLKGADMGRPDTGM